MSVALRRAGVPERYRAYGSADAILTRSSHQRDRLIDLGLPRDRIHVNPGGVDVPDRYAEPPDEPEFRCLAVGRMVAKKAPIFLLDAFRRAILADNRVCLDYVGSGPMFSAAQQFVAAFRLGRNVTLHSGIDYAGLDALRRRASAFVQHSVTDPETGDQEGLPASLQEAMAAGLPVVSTRHAGIPEAITDGVHGFLVAEGDVEAMAGRIVELSRNRHLVLSLGRAGWQKALEEYTWHAEQRRVLSIMGIDLPATR